MWLGPSPLASLTLADKCDISRSLNTSELLLDDLIKTIKVIMIVLDLSYKR